MSDENGFTFLEMLLVLFIVMLFTSIVFSFSIQYSEKKVIDYFMHQVQLDILRAQATAIEEQQRIEFWFGDNNRYKIYNEFGFTYEEKPFPEGITLIKESNLKVLKFSPFGEVNSFGKVRFLTSEGEKVLTIHIHKGRIRYEQ